MIGCIIRIVHDNGDIKYCMYNPFDPFKPSIIWISKDSKDLNEMLHSALTYRDQIRGVKPYLEIVAPECFIIKALRPLQRNKVMYLSKKNLVNKVSDAVRYCYTDASELCKTKNDPMNESPWLYYIQPVLM
jgi:hypothetical protein